MNRSYRIIPCYSGDVSGAAAALYELGGMMVIHDPSGCNSTYNTHDELRWYDQDSLIFISGLTQTDAILGNDEKFIEDIEDAARELQPQFIAMTSCPIPYMNGTDFLAIARILEQDLEIPSFFVETNGMHDYVRGAGNALASYAKHVLVPKNAERKRRENEGRLRVNILGATPLDFAHGDSMDSLRDWLLKQGFEPWACWSLDTDPQEIRKTPEADVNLVVSSVVVSLGRELQTAYGIPMVIGVPMGSQGEVLTQEILKTAGRDTLESAASLEGSSGASPKGRGKRVTLIGEPVLMTSAAACLRRAYPEMRVRVLCGLEASPDLLTAGDRFFEGEEELEQLLIGEDLVIADPLHEPILTGKTKLIRLPHLAFSGRCFRREFVDLLKQDPAEWVKNLLEQDGTEYGTE